MSSQAILAVGGLAAILTIGSAWVRAGSGFDSCGSELDRLRRAAASANDAAENTDSAEDDLEAATSLAESVCSGGATGYSCESARSDYFWKKSAYDRAKNAFESEYSTVTSRIRSVQSSCGDLVEKFPGVAPERQDTCRLLRGLSRAGVMTADERSALCGSLNVPDHECAICLQPR